MRAVAFDPLEPKTGRGPDRRIFILFSVVFGRWPVLIGWVLEIYYFFGVTGALFLVSAVLYLRPTSSYRRYTFSTKFWYKILCFLFVLTVNRINSFEDHLLSDAARQLRSVMLRTGLSGG
eukprot:SAG11_NODE_1093_length_5906_cov_10.683313_6_plen_120_part_00